jgi:hypothetical protein
MTSKSHCNHCFSAFRIFITHPTWSTCRDEHIWQGNYNFRHPYERVTISVYKLQVLASNRTERHILTHGQPSSIVASLLGKQHVTCYTWYILPTKSQKVSKYPDMVAPNYDTQSYWSKKSISKLQFKTIHYIKSIKLKIPIFLKLDLFHNAHYSTYYSETKGGTYMV